MITFNPELKGRSLLSLNDFTDEEMCDVINLAIELKKRRAEGTRGDLLHRKNIALVFEKGSTRTRCAATTAVRDEGGNAEYLNSDDIHIGVKESVKDTARVLGRMFDGILFRGFKQRNVELLAKYAGIPYGMVLPTIITPRRFLPTLCYERISGHSRKKLSISATGAIIGKFFNTGSQSRRKYVNCTRKNPAK